MRLVPYVARHLNINPRSKDYEDILQYGYIGLSLAAQKFDPEKGKFSGYAIQFISGHMKEYLCKHGIIHAPVKKVIQDIKDNIPSRVEVVYVSDNEVLAAKLGTSYCEQSTTEMYEEKERSMLIARAVSTMKGHSKSAIESILEEKSATDYAEEENICRQAADARIIKAKSSLKKKLELLGF